MQVNYDVSICGDCHIEQLFFVQIKPYLLTVYSQVVIVISIIRKDLVASVGARLGHQLETTLRGRVAIAYCILCLGINAGILTPA